MSQQPSASQGSPQMIERSTFRARPSAFPILGAVLSAGLASLFALPALAVGPAWESTLPEQPGAVLIQGATIWTSADTDSPEDAVLENTDLLIRNGEIAAIGTDLSVPSGAMVIDGKGKHVTAGLIDAHSHTAVLGAVNEGTNITTAEVRIADVLNPDDVGIYRQLAGGLTTMGILHGSANSIGGQNAVTKLRWGASAEEMLFTEAPQGIKFALGENPKQSNWGVQELRYPQTRQGVEQSIRERFLAARDYRAAWKAYEKAGGAKSKRVPPKRDFQLEAIAEILEGSRLVHSHSYRADEILMLLRLTEEFDVTVATFQHVLEGYKVADELASLGAGASTFSDWWAYKFEVIDAIPYNGAIMWDRDVVVSFNSDSDELARRMNLEAAKAVRYGGVPEAEALKFVTLNPAKQLGIDRWVGSLEVGKHADFVLWSGHPLSTYSVCEETWIDGRRYFSRTHDLEARKELAAQRQALMQEIRDLKSAEKAEAGEEGEEGEGDEESPEGEADAEPEAEPDPPRSRASAAFDTVHTHQEIER